MISAVHMSEEIEAHTNIIIGKNIFEYWLSNIQLFVPPLVSMCVGATTTHVGYVLENA